MTGRDELESDPVAQQLRLTLAERAGASPPAEFLAERILYAADHAASRRRVGRRAWRRRILPLVAASSVAIVVTSVLAVQGYDHHDRHVTAQAPQLSASPNRASYTSTDSTAGNSANSPVRHTGDLHAVRIVDLSFYSQAGGWALAAADCIGKPGRCTALLRTTNGTDWQSVGNAVFNVPGITGGCASPCVHNIRFATPHIGYAFGPHALFMTLDGGATWRQQPGGAIFLETLDDNVIRVSSTNSGCPSWCNIAVETSTLGSILWMPAGSANAGNRGFGVQFARDNAANAYLLFLGSTVGGAQNADSTLYRSSDDGRTWVERGEPCAETGQHSDSVALAAGSGGTLSVLCASQATGAIRHIVTSTDGAKEFKVRPATVPGMPSLLAGDPRTTLIGVGDEMARSTNGGETWSNVAGVTGPFSFVGFESPVNGRAVGNGGRTIYSTKDAGATWTAFSLP